MLGDYDFQEVYGLEMLDGEFFSEEIATHKTGVIINEKLARDLSWNDPIGKKFDIPGEFENGHVIGVVKDFHTKSLHLPIEPMAIVVTERQYIASIKVSGPEIASMIGKIESIFHKIEPNYPMEILALNQITSNMYTKERSFAQVLTFFSILAIVIAGLGQIGLIYYLVNSRAKELSIRKVLGASTLSMMTTLSGRFQLLILIGFILSVPVSYFVVQNQLENYAYSISIGVIPFFILGISIMALAWLLSSFQTYKASTINPADYLKNE